MMKLEGDGDLTVNGFTKLGGATADVPAVKMKIFTGNISTSGITTTVAHGLTWNKIVEIQVLVSGVSNKTVSDNFEDFSGTSAGYSFSKFFDATNVYITRQTGTPSVSITPVSGLVPTYKILVTYIP